MKSGHRRNHLSAILLVFLGFPDLIQWQNTWAKIANPTCQFLDHNNWGILPCHRNETLWQASCLCSGFSFWFPFLWLLQSNADWNLVEYLIFSITYVEQHKFKIQSIILQDLQWESIAKFTRKSIVLSFAYLYFIHLKWFYWYVFTWHWALQIVALY